MHLTTTISAIALVAGALSPVAFSLASPGLPALRTTVAVSSASSESESETHCVGEALPVDSIEAPPEPVCFDTSEEAVAYLDEVTQAKSRGATGSVVLGTVYSDANYGGSTYSLFGSGTCAGVTFGFPSLSGGWDSSISSAKAASGCWVTLYKTTSYGGEKINCMPGCPTVGSLNDQVHSLVFRPQGTVG